MFIYLDILCLDIKKMKVLRNDLKLTRNITNWHRNQGGKGRLLITSVCESQFLHRERRYDNKSITKRQQQQQIWKQAIPLIRGGQIVR